jgi:hypothetical protein
MYKHRFSKNLRTPDQFIIRMDQQKNNEELLKELMKEEPNKYCADCGQKGVIVYDYRN